MGIRRYNPVTAGRRGASVSDFAELTPGAEAPKALLRPKPKTGGRNNQGRITSRHIGGGHKQQYRLIDFRRNKDTCGRCSRAVRVRLTFPGVCWRSRVASSITQDCSKRSITSYHNTKFCAPLLNCCRG